jgi:hypothetical protein
MKNIHLLPTDKPSRLFRSELTNNLGLDEKSTIRGGRLNNQHIYIISDEEIKEGDWVIDEDYDEFLVYKADRIFFEIGKDAKKIILTTDQDLIEDRVQEVDEEFLKWFVKNPSCEKVKLEHIGYVDAYKIIIPKEEPKQIKCYDKFNQILKEGDYVDVQKDGIYKIYKKEDGQLYFNPYGGEDKVSNYFSNDMVKCDKDGNWITNNQYKDIDEHKQETFEDAAKDFIENTMKFSFTSNDTKTLANRMLKCVEFGAKWQQEQIKNMYSEEEVRKMFSKYNEVIAHRDIEEWQPWIDKQFKKK